LIRIYHKQEKSEPICKNCKWFYSFRIIYEDDLEPDDCGWCKFNRHGNKGFTNQAGYYVNDDDSCEHFEAC